MFHVVYVIQSLKDKSFYIGCSSDMKKRLEQHNKGRIFSTKIHVPWILIYCECFRSQEDAFDREQKLKNHGKGFQELKKRIMKSKM